LIALHFTLGRSQKGAPMTEFEDDFDDGRDYPQESIAWLRDKSPDVWFHVAQVLSCK
jgi:hypothetical protein